MDEIGEHGVELLRLAAMNFVGAQMLRPSSRSHLVPFAQERFLRPPRFAPTDTVAHGGMRGWHRLAVQPNKLTQPSRDARLGIGEGDLLGASPCVLPRA